MITLPEHKPRKRGRPAKLTKDERAAIQSSTDSIASLAERFGVSLATITRIRSEWYEYVTADEEGVAAHSCVTGRKAHATLTPQERRQIAEDRRSAPEVAAAFGVSLNYVHKLRKRYGTTHATGSMIPISMIKAIVTSEVNSKTLAQRHGIPVELVDLIRQRGGLHEPVNEG